MRTEISKLHDRLQTTMIYVTHDQIEAMTMGDRICVMKDGMMMQIDKPLEIYNKPANKFVASFIGSPPMNFMDVQVSAARAACVWMRENLCWSFCHRWKKRSRPMWGKSWTLGVRPEDIYDKVYAGNIATEGRAAVSTVEVVERWAAKFCSILILEKTPWSPASSPRAKPKSIKRSKFSSLREIRLFDKETQERIL